jgi:hypothetical protein
MLAPSGFPNLGKQEAKFSNDWKKSAQKKTGFPRFGKTV